MSDRLDLRYPEVSPDQETTIKQAEGKLEAAS